MKTLPMTQEQPITTPQAVYLKHAGDLLNAKVTIKILGGLPVIDIGDFEFDSFRRALIFLQHISQTLAPEPSGEEADGLDTPTFSVL